ncbi:MAG TPA: NADPH-dependent FMN reductase [Thermoanaerobaculia bacterium]|jgi:NAD(P)H-dependent FMN reductase
MRILAISGSLRAASSNTSLLRAAQILAPPQVEIVLETGLGELPHFNPDLEDAMPATVAGFRARIGEADALLISTPEYAHGVPGVLKNAFDWLVSGPEFVGKTVGLLNASPRSTYAQESLIETLTVMSARMCGSYTVSLWGRKLDADGIAADAELSALIRDALDAFLAAARASHPR